MPKPSRPDLGHRGYRRAREEMFAIYGTTCHICAHPGAREADHLVPYSRLADKTRMPSAHDMRPAHGGNARCPVCLRACNAERGNRPIPQRMNHSEDW
ncbi:hypothetical protein PV350_23560 [Streptomyces sp. PA03-6a]|nr:hypothetical protein [Streptomyces sp. PA03-6a]